MDMVVSSPPHPQARYLMQKKMAPKIRYYDMIDDDTDHFTASN